MLFILLSILLSITSSNEANPIKNKANKMDAFISQLMASEKFEEFADIIVERAVSKIKDIEQRSNQNNSESRENKFTFYKHSSDDDEPKESKSVHLGNGHTNLMNSNPIETVKLGAHTLLKDRTEELLLSFKRIRELHGQKQTNIKTTQKSDSKNKTSLEENSEKVNKETNIKDIIRKELTTLHYQTTSVTPDTTELSKRFTIVLNPSTNSEENKLSIEPFEAKKDRSKKRNNKIKVKKSARTEKANKNKKTQRKQKAVHISSTSGL